MSLTQLSPLSTTTTTMMSSAIGLQQSPKFFQSSGSLGVGPPRFQSNFQKSNHHHHHHHHHQHHHQHQVLNATQFRPLAPSTQQGGEFDGKRLRKAVTRRTIDYNAAVVRQIQLRVWQRDRRDHRAIQPDYSYYPEMVPPPFFVHNPINAVTTKFVRTSTNKMRCPIFCVAWTPEGRRLVTGASSGEFTLWNGLTFNFETILQAHDSPVRCMVWSHTDQWMVTGDHAGFVKYWQSNMNNVKMFQAHKEPLRGISFCPTDTKFATCSDDGTVRIWDFLRCYEEKILRGHGADVKCVAWHPQKALLVSGSKDSQQPIKLWDPKSGQSLATLHAHKSTVMEAKWNDNGNWLLTGSRDHLIKLFDIRKLSQEVQTFRGHKKEVSSLAWHPMHESLFASGGSDGALMFWLTGVDKEVGSMEQAHDSIVWSLDWHPLGHILCSGSNDHTCKFWTRNRPGDKMRDKYNLNMMPIGGSMDDNSEYDDVSMAPSIPGMGLEQLNHVKTIEQIEEEMLAAAIPGLDFGSEEPQMLVDHRANIQKKIPYSKPIPRQFQQQWMDTKPMLGAPPPEGPMKVVGDTQNSLPSLNPAMIPLPPQHVVHNVPPPPVPSQQAFANRAMMGGDLTQGPPPPIRMPMIWSSRPPGMSEGQMRSSFPPIGNGSPFALPPPTISGGSGSSGVFSDMMANKASVLEKAASKNWKEFGDSDFRVQTMDSDLRMLNSKPMPSEHRVEGVSGDAGDSKHGPPLPPSNAGGDEQDKDMRTQLRDTDSRVPHEFGGGGGGGGSGGGGGGGSLSASQNNNDGRSDGSSDGTRRGRWGSFVGRVRDSGTSFSNQPTFGKGDLDERLLASSQEGSGGSGSGTLPPPPNFSQPPPPARKRGWDVGPGMVDLNSQNHRDGGGSSNQQKPPAGLPPSSSSSSSSSQSSSQGIGVSQRDPPSHMQSRGDDKGMRIGDGRQRFIPPPPPIPGRGMPPWGGPMRMGMRGPPPGSQGGGGGGGGGGWFRGGGGPFRSGPPPNRGRMGMRGPFPS